jgi:hypothetical protein
MAASSSMMNQTGLGGVVGSGQCHYSTKEGVDPHGDNGELNTPCLFVRGDEDPAYAFLRPGERRPVGSAIWWEQQAEGVECHGE